MRMKIAVVMAFMSLVGCSSTNVSQAHKARHFDSTGAAAFWANPTGFHGDVVGPGTYYTGMYGSMRAVDCSQITHKETLSALTKDGVQFALDVYIRMSAKCDVNESVIGILDVLSPAPETAGDPAKDILPSDGRTITNQQLYVNYIRPGIGEAVRQAVSPYVANDINNEREKIFKVNQKTFLDSVAQQKPPLVVVYEVKLSNLDFPDALETANVERAQQAILKDKAIAEREKIVAETETAAARLELERKKADNEALRISLIGQALKANPAYMEYTMLQQLPGIYQDAGVKGNMIITAPNPSVFLSPRAELLPAK